jgi:hypothetical protein
MCTVMTIRKFMNSRHLLMQTAVLLLAVMVPPALADSPIEITAGGMQYKTLLEGEGSPAVEGQVVHIHFVGRAERQGTVQLASRQGTYLLCAWHRQGVARI